MNLELLFGNAKNRLLDYISRTLKRELETTILVERMKLGEKNVAEPAECAAAESDKPGTKMIDVGMVVESILKVLCPLFSFCRSFRRRCPAVQV